MTGRSYPLAVVITGVDRATRVIAGVRAEVNRVGSEVTSRVGMLNMAARSALSSGTMMPELPRVGKEARAVATAVQGIGTAAQSTMRRVGVMAAGAGAAVYGFKSQFVDTTDQFQRLGISLEAIEGSAEKAGASMRFVKTLGKDSPFEVAEVADAFRQMRNVGMDAKSDSFGLQAIADQVAKFGGNGEALNGVTLALTQMYSSNRVGAQDMLQLLNRQIPAWMILQRTIERTTGKTIKIGQLKKMAEAGAFEQRTVLEMIKTMGLESQGQAAKMNRTFGGLLSNMADQWTFFKLRVMKIDDSGRAIGGGLADRLQKGLDGALKQIDVMAKDGRLDRWADQIGSTLSKGFTRLETEGPQALANFTQGLQTVYVKADAIAQTFGGWGRTIAAIGGAYAFAPLVSSIANVTNAVTTLTVALSGTPAGRLLLGVTAAAGAATYLGHKNRQQYEDWMSGKYKTSVIHGRAAVDERLDRLRELQARMSGRLPLGAETSATFQPTGPLPSAASSGLDAATFARLSDAIKRPAGGGGVAGFLGRLQVDFKNAPPGTRTRFEGGAGSSVDVGQHVEYAH